MKEQTRQAAARGDAAVTPLADLEFNSFLDKDGKVASVDTKGVKASVYAVYDEVRNTPACAQVVQTQVLCTRSRSLRPIVRGWRVPEQGRFLYFAAVVLVIKTFIPSTEIIRREHLHRDHVKIERTGLWHQKSTKTLIYCRKSFLYTNGIKIAVWRSLFHIQ